MEVAKENEGKVFSAFTRFLIEKWGDVQIENIEERRNTAYQALRKKIKGKTVAEASTIQAWFGIKRQSRPDREHFFRLALALELTPQEAQEYLQEGLLMPGVQINDYQEAIYYYGLENHLTWEECQGMIDVFEYHMGQDVVLEQHTHTNELWSAYFQWHSLDKEHFLDKMCKNAGMFKGYGKTALKYFLAYKNEILECVREEAKLRLKMELQETGFFEWARENEIGAEQYGEAILRYVRNESRRKNPRITKERWKEIEDYYWKAYAISDRNSILIEQLRPGERDVTVEGKSGGTIYPEKEQFQIPDSVRFFSKGVLSLLLGISAQKEKQIQLSQALAQIRFRQDGESCPAWIVALLVSEKGDTQVKKQCKYTCKEAKKKLEKQILKQKKNCRTIQREDLLPLIHCVAQIRYETVCQTEDYNQKEAKQLFVELADATLTACQMAPINEEYELDNWLLSCFGEDEMISYMEKIEQSKRE